MTIMQPLPVPHTTAGETRVIFSGLNPQSPEALDRFDTAYRPYEPDQALLSGTPARTLAEAISNFLASLSCVDIERVLKQQGWWSRFTGADLEAHVELEVAAHRLSHEMQSAAMAAATARGASAAMRADIPKLDAAQKSHQALADATAQFLDGSDLADPTVARLQRRLANLIALQTSNRLIRAQLEMAIDHVAGLLDRFTDIEQVLFPVWKHHALLIAQSASSGEPEPGDTQQLRSVHAQLASALPASRTES